MTMLEHFTGLFTITLGRPALLLFVALISVPAAGPTFTSPPGEGKVAAIQATPASGDTFKPTLVAPDVGEGCTEQVVDGGFEGGTPNAAWSEYSTNFGTPLCSAGCGTGGSGPHAGSWWAWFGGIDALETGQLQQSVTIPTGVATLSFWLAVPFASGTGSDTFSVSLDGASQFSITDAASGTYPTYTLVALDVSGFANGGSHLLSLDAQNYGGGVTNFMVDDVSLQVCGGGGPPAHDNFGAAHTIAALPYQGNDNTANATTAGNDPIFPCGSLDQGGHSVWYRFTPPTTSQLHADTHGSNYDTMLAIWTGTAGSLTNIACNDDSYSPEYSLQSEVKFTAQAGVTYYAEVASYGSASGGFLSFHLTPADKWISGGPWHPSPSINELTIDPQSPNTVYAATREGVYKSTDAGLNWQAKLDGLGTYGGLEVTNVVIDRSNSQNVYISTWGDGVYKSSDGGENWILTTDPVALNGTGETVEGLERVRAGGPALFPMGADAPPTSKNAGSLAGAIGGEFARQGPLVAAVVPEPRAASLPPDPLDWTPARYLAIHPTNPGRLIVTISANGAYITQNGGTNWSPLTLPGATSPSGRAVAFAPSNPNIAYLSMGDWTANGGIFRSADGGLTWTPVPGNGSVTSVVTHFAVDPGNPNHVLAATYGQGVMATTNGGANWSPSSSGMTDSSLYNIEFSPVDANIVYATGYLWIWRSVNGGANWVIADSSYPDYETSALALHPTNANVAYAGALQHYVTTHYFGGGVYKTTNGGNTFNLQVSGMQNTFVLDVEPDPVNPNIVYAGTWGSGFYRSTDWGLTWSQGNAGLVLPFVYSVEAIPDGSGGTVLLAGTFYSNAALFISFDWGQNWSELPAGTLPALARNVFDIESSDGTSSNLVIATGDGIHTSGDGGSTWAPAQLSGGGATENIVLDIERVPTISGRLVAATYHDGIYYSNNSGSTWSYASGEPSTYVFGLSASAFSSEVYAATLGLAKSTNGGVAWSPVVNGVPSNLFFRAVDHNLDGTEDVYAGSVGQGMWVSANGSDSWLPLAYSFPAERVRSVNASFQYPLRALAGTDGHSVWSFTPYQLPSIRWTYLPAVPRQ